MSSVCCWEREASVGADIDLLIFILHAQKHIYTHMEGKILKKHNRSPLKLINQINFEKPNNLIHKPTDCLHQ